MKNTYTALMTILAIIFVPNTSLAQSGGLGKIFYEPVFEQAVDYEVIPSIVDCRPDTRKPPKYHICKDSAKIYALALAGAKAKNQPLMVVFGFDSCLPCLVLASQIFDDKRPIEGRDVVGFYSKPALAKFRKQNKPLKISVVYIHSRAGHGLALADTLGVTKMAKDRGWKRVWAPFIAFVNPNTGKLHSESYWEAKEGFCDWGAEFAASIEGIDMAEKGIPYQDRKRCPI